VGTAGVHQGGRRPVEGTEKRRPAHSLDYMLDYHVVMSSPGRPAIHSAVVEILKDVSRRPIEPALDSDLIADLGFDSLQVMETIAALEDRFGVAVSTEQAQQSRTVAQIVAQVGALVDARTSA
jgi:acyl carrier protein